MSKLIKTIFELELSNSIENTEKSNTWQELRDLMYNSNKGRTHELLFFHTYSDDKLWIEFFKYAKSQCKKLKLQNIKKK